MSGTNCCEPKELVVAPYPRERPTRVTLRPLGKRHLEEMGPQRNRSAKKRVREETIFVVVNASQRANSGGPKAPGEKAFGRNGSAKK